MKMCDVNITPAGAQSTIKSIETGIQIQGICNFIMFIRNLKPFKQQNSI